MTGITKRKHSSKFKEEINAYIFIAPFMVLFVIFVLVPIIYSFILSFLDFNTLKRFNEMNFVGFDNFKALLKDDIAKESYIRSFIYSIIAMPAYVLSGFIFAVLLNRKFYCRTLSRTMIFLPYVANVAAVAMVWSVILDPMDGPVNTFLRAVGIENPPLWLGSVNVALPTVAVLAAITMNALPIIIYLAALQEVPEELYESATIDGANWFKRIIHITVPIVSPTTFFLVVTSLISSFQNFAIIRCYTNGGPGMATRTISVNMYEIAFRNNEYSYATAQAVILFIIILIITFIQWRGQKKWVHY